ncbi:DUF4252 domain-containing protein [Wenyingzhuangia sp. IMCC45574]
MKNVLNISIFILFTTIGFAQNKSFDKIFEKYADQDGFTTVNVSGDMIQAFSDDKDIKDLNIGNIKVLTVEDDKLNNGVNFYKEVVSKLSLKKYDKLINVEGEDTQVLIAKKKKNKGKPEFLIITGGDENTMVYIEGDLNFGNFGKVLEGLKINSSSVATSK